MSNVSIGWDIPNYRITDSDDDIGEHLAQGGGAVFVEVDLVTDAIQGKTDGRDVVGRSAVQIIDQFDGDFLSHGSPSLV